MEDIKKWQGQQIVILLTDFVAERWIFLTSTLWNTKTIKILHFVLPGFFCIIYSDTKLVANNIKQTNKRTHVDENTSQKTVTRERRSERMSVPFCSYVFENYVQRQMYMTKMYMTYRNITRYQGLCWPLSSIWSWVLCKVRDKDCFILPYLAIQFEQSHLLKCCLIANVYFWLLFKLPVGSISVGFCVDP